MDAKRERKSSLVCELHEHRSFTRNFYLKIALLFAGSTFAMPDTRYYRR